MNRSKTYSTMTKPSEDSIPDDSLEFLKDKLVKKKYIKRTSGRKLMLVTGIYLITIYYNRVPSFPCIGQILLSLSLSLSWRPSHKTHNITRQMINNLFFLNYIAKSLWSQINIIKRIISTQLFRISKKNVYISHQYIDESMAKFKGGFIIKQYTPLKHIKRGTRLWARCDSSTGICIARQRE